MVANSGNPRLPDEVRTTDGVEAAAEAIVDSIRQAVHSRGECTLALGGGRSPADLYRALSTADLPWESISIMQTDERLSSAGPDHSRVRHLGSLEVGLCRGVGFRYTAVSRCRRTTLPGSRAYHC